MSSPTSSAWPPTTTRFKTCSAPVRFSLRPEPVSYDDFDMVESSVRPPRRTGSEWPIIVLSGDVDDFDFDDDPVSRRALATPDPRIEDHRPPPMRPFMGSAPDVVVVDDDLEAAEEVASSEGVGRAAHVQKAVVDAESFRGLRLYSKAIETLRIALEMDPMSTDIREKLRDVLAEAGDRDGAIGEMISLAALYMDRGDGHLAEVGALPGARSGARSRDRVRDARAAAGYGTVAPYTDEPYDSTTTEVADPDLFSDPEIIGEAEIVREAFDPEEPLPSYDFEEVPAVRRDASSAKRPIRPHR